jgi:hypothetical protein
MRITISPVIRAQAGWNRRRRIEPDQAAIEINAARGVAAQNRNLASGRMQHWRDDGQL